MANIRGVDLNNLFGPVTKDSIRVGYISIENGYVYDYTICEANDYAQKNPGTTFIFKDGDNNVRYLNINEVNALTVDDITSSDRDECGGLQQVKLCGPAKVQFFGGGGVGAAANPIIGLDGAVLAVDVVRGGYGYQYAPIVEIKDNCGFGNGSLLTSVLGETSEINETFEDEESFEDYEICLDTTAGYGSNWGPNGEDLGPWDPRTYTDTDADPIANEILKYQKSISSLSKPFWTTQSETPARIVSGTENFNTVYNVTFPAWNEFMNRYAISPVPPSNVPGSDFAGKLFTFEWEQRFPYDGEYIFRGLCDNAAKLYIDNLFVYDLEQFNGSALPIQKTYKAGFHTIRLDLLNTPINKKINRNTFAGSPKVLPALPEADSGIRSAPGIYLDLTSFPNQPIGVSFRQVSPGGGVRINIPEIGTISSVGAGNYNSADSYSNLVGLPRNPVTGEVTLQGGRIYGPCTIVQDNNYRQTDLYIGLNLPGEFMLEGGPSANPPRTYSYYQRVISLQAEDWGFRPDVNAIGGFAIIKAPPDTEKNYTINDATLEPELFAMLNERSFNEASIYLGESVDFIYFQASQGFFRRYSQPFVPPKPPEVIVELGNEPIVTPDLIGSTTSDSLKLVQVFNTLDYIDKANRRLWRSRPRTDLRHARLINGYGICPFDVTTQEAQSRSYAGTHTIIWNNVNFPVTGNYKIEIAVDDNVTLYIGDTIINKIGFSAPGVGLPSLNETYSFKEGNYTIRAELEQIEVGPIGTQNPMDLAITIETLFTTETVLSAASWNENPMGVTLSIDAPSAPIPREKAPVQEGRCPPNPIWSTRFPGSTENWYPVRFSSPPWSRFMNRYALSPVIPLDTPGSDSVGVTFSTEWTVTAPYKGFYGVKATADNRGKIYIDNQEVHIAQGFNVELPKAKKIFLSKGDHTIKVEVLNDPIKTSSVIDKKIFSTLDWQSKQSSTVTQQVETIDMIRYFTHDFSGPAESQHFITSNASKEDIEKNQLKEEGLAFKLFKNTDQVSGTVNVYRLFNGPNGDHLYTTDVNEKDSLVNAGSYTLEGIVGAAYNQPGSGRAEVIRYFRPKTGEHFLTLDTNEIQTLPALGFQRQGIAFYSPTVIPEKSSQTNSNFVTQLDAITYDGPPLFHFNETRWSSYMNKYSVSPFFDNLNLPNDSILGIFTLTWKNVNFPEDGKYDIKMQADNIAILKIAGRDIRGTSDFVGDPLIEVANISKGTYDVVIELTNTTSSNIFTNNPMGVALEITKKITIEETTALSWQTNPMAISAILIPPPCPKKISGKGVVVKVIIDDPGNENPDCPPGQTRDRETGLCVDILDPCPTGQRRDPVTGKCVDLPPCPQGEVRDLVTGKCVKSCPPGEERNPVTGLCVKICPPGKVRNPITGYCEEPCPPGEERDPISGECVKLCPPGQKRDPATGLCVEKPSPCPPGQKRDPETGLCVPDLETPPEGTPPITGYPVCLILDEVIVSNSGINYNCGVDRLQCTPNNGVILEYDCDPFGKIKNVKIVDSGTCFPVYPTITLPSETGVNAEFKPVFRVVRDPIDPALTREAQKLIQVTDLVGLKQTGYIDGRVYYGSVYLDNGAKFAGYYKTIGEPVRVYDTLQESITAKVTTPPSAIQRFGTDVTSNDPTLNIPNTFN